MRMGSCRQQLGEAGRSRRTGRSGGRDHPVRQDRPYCRRPRSKAL